MGQGRRPGRWRGREGEGFHDETFPEVRRQVLATKGEGKGFSFGAWTGPGAQSHTGIESLRSMDVTEDWTGRGWNFGPDCPRVWIGTIGSGRSSSARLRPKSQFDSTRQHTNHKPKATPNRTGKDPKAHRTSGLLERSGARQRLQVCALDEAR